MRSRFSSGLLVLAMLPLLALSGAPSTLGVTATQCVPVSPAFAVRAVTWGTPASPVAAGPGDQNVPLTLTVQYYDVCTVAGLNAVLTLPQGFADASGGSTSAAYAVSIPPNTVFQLTFNLNIAPSASLGSYAVPLSLRWNSTTTNTGAQAATIAVPLKGRVAFSIAPASQSLVAGSVNRLTLSLSNTGAGNATNVSVSVTPSPTLSVVSQPTVGATVAGSGSTTISMAVFAPATSAGSPVSLSFAVGYQDGYLVQRTYAQTVGMFVGSAPSGDFALSASAASLAIGSVNNLGITLTNLGANLMGNLTVAVSPGQSASLVGSDGHFSLGTVPAGASREMTVPVYVSQSSLTSTSLSLTVAYTTPASAVAETRTLSFLVYDQVSDPYLSVGLPSSLVSGQVNQVGVVFSNTGASPIADISLTFNSPQGPISWLSPATLELASLQPGQNVTVSGSAYVAASSTPSTSFQGMLSYRGANNTLYQETRNYLILSRGAVDLELTGVTLLPQVAEPGQILSMTLTLTNLGTTAASGVKAAPMLPQGFKSFGSSSYFIGSMQVDTPSTFTLTALVANESAGKSYTIPVTVSYMDNLREPFNLTLNIPVTVGTTSGPSQGGSGQQGGGAQPRFELLYVAIALIAVAGVGGYFLGRRRGRAGQTAK